MNNNKFGFTLAEVLITLGIIGVVCAMTIPTLVKNYKNEITISGIKTTTNILSNGMKQIIANEGCNDLMCTGLFSEKIDDTYYTNIDNAMKKVFKNIKSCFGGNQCDYRVSGLTADPYVNEGVSSNMSSYATAGEYKYILPNGVIFYIANTQCVETKYPTISSIKNICASIIFDINGKKSPNKWGRDIFYFDLAQDGSLYPHNGIEVAKFNAGSNWKRSNYYWTTSTDYRNCSSTTRSYGYACAARIIENGWKIDY